MDLTSCTRTTTHRQYKAWLEWLKEQWNTPDIVCHYLMQLSAQVCNLFAKSPVKSEKFKIEFEFPGDKTKKHELTEAEKASIVMQSKHRWGMISGLFGWKKSNPETESKIPIGSK